MAMVSTTELARRVAKKLGTNIDTALDIIDCIMFEAKLDIKTRNFSFLPDIGKFFIHKNRMRDYMINAGENIVRFNPAPSFRAWLNEIARENSNALP